MICVLVFNNIKYDALAIPFSYESVEKAEKDLFDIIVEASYKKEDQFLFKNCQFDYSDFVFYQDDKVFRTIKSKKYQILTLNDWFYIYGGMIDEEI